MLQISDIGLGELEKNAADVFNRLRNVTVRKGVVNSFANVDASISVLKTMSDKQFRLSNVTATRVSIKVLECHLPKT